MGKSKGDIAREETIFIRKESLFSRVRYVIASKALVARLCLNFYTSNRSLASPFFLMKTRAYIAHDLKLFYASVVCVERGLDPLATNLVVGNSEREGERKNFTGFASLPTEFSF